MAGVEAAAGRPPVDFGLPPALAAGGRILEAAVEFGRLCWDSMVAATTPAEKLVQILRLVAHIQDKVREKDFPSVDTLNK